jgi:lysophospholipase L1-like esterase
MTYMKDSTGRRLDSFAVSPLRKPTIVLFGDSRTADCSYSNLPADGTATQFYSTPVSWFDYGQAFRAGGPVFDVLANAGVGGNTTTQMLARMDTDVIALKPSHMTLWGGTNDPWTSFAEVDNTMGRMAQMMDKARAAGIYTFLISETTANSKGTTFPKYVAYHNELLRAYAATNAGVEFWDFNAIITNPADANGYHKSALLRDGLHLSPLGATTIGRDVVAKKLARIGTELAQLPVAQIDTMNLSTGSRNVANNPIMQGTTGTLSGGQTGTVPTSWAISGIASTQSVPARADGVGYDLKTDLTAAAAGSHYSTLTVDPARLVAGAKYVLEAAQSIDAATGLSAISLTASMFVGGAQHQRGFGFRVQSLVASDALVTGDLVIRSRPFTCPSGVTGANVVQQISMSGSGSATVRLGRLAWRRIA